MEPGDLVADRFEIDRLAGAGGMGSVYRARDRLTGEAVALKVLHRAGKEDDRFAREARVLADLHHPGIVRYVAHGAERGELYLAMEWLDGEDLEKRLARAGLAVDESVALVARVADALAAAHARGVVHRDIKPSNIFLVDGRIDRVRLLDFGIARLGRGTRATRTGVLMGTPGYMAPEQARGERDLDARVDLFSLGSVLFECLAGQPAFAGESFMALFAKILLADAPRVSELRPDVPPELDALVARMLQKAPDARPSSAAAVAAELGAIHGLVPRSREPARAPAPHAALTDSERRLVSVIVARLRPADVDHELAPTLAAEDDADARARVRRAVEPAGAQIEWLADGSVLATIAVSAGATDRAARAARCALAMRAALPDAPLVLATGRGVLAGRVPIGEVIDRAAATLDAAAGAPLRHGVRIDDRTAGLLDERFEIRGDEAGLLLLGEREPAQPGRRLLGKQTPCVGRERELGTLVAIFDECVSEPVARAVVVTAPAGVGKSRLRGELSARLAGRGEPVEIWLGRGDAMAAGSPFGMIARAVRRAAGVQDGEPLAVRRQKLRARVGRHVAPADVARVADFIGELAGAPAPDDESVEVRAARKDPVLMGDQIKRAWEDLVTAECAAQPLLLVLEDLHWGDVPSVKLVDLALKNLRDAPLMVLALARPEVEGTFPRLWSGRAVTEMKLFELSRKASEKLVRAALGAGLPAETVDRLVAQAAGNAFYLEELIRAVADGRGDALPETVLAMVGARLEAIEPDARRVLRAASVFGEIFWADGVTALLGGAHRTTAVGEWLAELCEREILVRRPDSKFADQAELAFAQSALREAAYAMLTDKDRELGHKLAAEWLERSGEHEAWVLAQHWERGGEPGRAVACYRRAAEQALEGDDLEAAIARAERGIACGAAGEGLAALRHLQANAHLWRAENADGVRCLLEALEHAPVGSRTWLDTVRDFAFLAVRVDRIAQLEAFAADLLSIEPSSDDRPAYLLASARVGCALYAATRWEAAEALHLRVDASAGAVETSDPMLAMGVLLLVHTRATMRGDLVPVRLLEELARCCGAAGERRGEARQLVHLADLYLELGAHDDAETSVRAAVEMAERMGLHHVTTLARVTLARVALGTGRFDEARALATAAVESFQAQGNRSMSIFACSWCATALAAAGELDGAEQEARRALQWATAAEDGAYPRALLARIALARSRNEDALAAAEEAYALLLQSGRLRLGEGVVRLTYAEALDACGRRDDARPIIAAARERLLARALVIDEERHRATFFADVAENARTMALAREWLEEAPGPAGA